MFKGKSKQEECDGKQIAVDGPKPVAPSVRAVNNKPRCNVFRSTPFPPPSVHHHHNWSENGSAVPHYRRGCHHHRHPLSGRGTQGRFGGGRHAPSRGRGEREHEYPWHHGGAGRGLPHQQEYHRSDHYNRADSRGYKQPRGGRGRWSAGELSTEKRQRWHSDTNQSHVKRLKLQPHFEERSGEAAVTKRSRDELLAKYRTDHYPSGAQMNHLSTANKNNHRTLGFQFAANNSGRAVGASSLGFQFAQQNRNNVGRATRGASGVSGATCSSLGVECAKSINTSRGCAVGSGGSMIASRRNVKSEGESNQKDNWRDLGLDNSFDEEDEGGSAAAASKTAGLKSNDGNNNSNTVSSKHNAAMSTGGKKSEQYVIDMSNDPDKTHVIFAIDFSSSMMKTDIKTSNGNTSRWEAVFDCVDTLLIQQLGQQKDAATFVSVLIFNDESKVLLSRMELSGDGSAIRESLKKSKNDLVPKGGTGFSAGFQGAQQLACSHTDDKVICVFLSDGRPGDLKHTPPRKHQHMQATFNRHKKTYPAAGVFIEGMQKNHSDFSLQLICLANEGLPWMRYLANRYNGTFHNPDLTLDENPAVAAQSAQASGHNNQNDCSDSEEEEEVEIMKVKSQGTLIRERMQRAKASGNVVSCLTTTASNSSSIRSTFSSISATVTAMRNGPRRQEREVTIKQESAMVMFQATRMVLKEDKIVTAPGETANGRRIRVALHPFAQGGLRNVYKMKQGGESQQVAKESRHDIQYSERLKFHVETARCQAQALVYANQFNLAISNLKLKKGSRLLDVPHIDVLSAEVYRLKAPRYPCGFRYLAVEKQLEGQYEKFNNNDGFVNQSNCTKCMVAQAFSHFSYETSRQQEMVVDIQGAGFVYTDPQLHSHNKEFGRADRGTTGFDKFLHTHKCNFICKGLRLKTRSVAV